jgi:hypothetical protein
MGFKDNPLRSLFSAIHFQYLLIKGFVLAAISKKRKSMARVKLPAVAFTRTPDGNGADEALVRQAINAADRLTHTLVHFTTRKCFFRAFTAGYLLRKKGIAVTLNMGLHHLDKSDRNVRGHCWLSWQGNPIGECNDPHVRYHRFLGAGKNGVCYWLGGKKTAKRKIVHYRTTAKGPKENAAFEN